MQGWQQEDRQDTPNATMTFPVTEEKIKFANFGEDADFHGIKHLVRAENGIVRRVIWGVLLFVSVGILINNVTSQTLLFFQYEHNTIYDIEFVHDLDFPAITICNVNKFRRSAFTQFDIVSMGPHLGMTDEDYNLLHDEHYDTAWVATIFTDTDWEAVKTANAGTEFNLTEFYDRTGHQKHDLIQHCEWKSDVCNDSSWEVSFTHYGKCYTFNKNGDHQLKKAGAGNGLHVVLYDEEDEYIESHDSEDKGIKFLPHAYVEPPFLKEMGSGAAPGYHFQIALQQREIQGLPAPYTECEKDQTTKYFANYTVSGCRIECETEAIYEEFGCRLVESPGDYPVCSPEQLDWAEAKLEEIEKSDSCLCHNPCHATQYPYKLSFLEVRESTVERLQTEHSIPAALTKEKLIILNIYFDSLSFESIIQTPAYTFISILSDFGGTMGLWLGASILALGQMFDYCIMKCCFACAQRKAKQKTEVQPMQAVDEKKHPGEDDQTTFPCQVNIQLETYRKI